MERRAEDGDDIRKEDIKNVRTGTERDSWR